MTSKENDTTNTAATMDKQKTTNDGDTANPPIVQNTDSHKDTVLSPEDCLVVDPLEISIGQDLVSLADPAKGGDMLDRINRLRNEIATEIGFILPRVRVRDSRTLEKTEYRFLIDGQPVATSNIFPDRLLALPNDEVAKKIRGIAVTEPAYGTPAIWINEADKARAEKRGYTVVEPSVVITTHLLETVRKHAYEILTLDMTQYMLDKLSETCPVTVQAALNVLEVRQIRQVLKGLLYEHVPIRQLETILDALGDYGKQTKDSDILESNVRIKLARTICRQYRDENSILNVVMLAPALEKQIRAGFEHNANGLFIRMSPQAIEKLCKQITPEVDKLISQNRPPIVLVEPRIRAALKYMTLATMPDLIVLSLAEITRDTQIVSVGVVKARQTEKHGRSGKKRIVAERGFSTALLNCDTDLEKLTKRIIGLEEENFSLCLYGVPGSGKSAYARFLAEKLNMGVLHKRASDLFGKWIGETEKNIAAAFAEALKKKMLLVFDEADSFLQDRRNAQRSWEVTQVNEMLTQMESHPLPFVCTTNLMDDLDQASLRRFTFKVKYDFLTRQQTECAFKHFFGADCTSSLGGLTCLSPGDFAVVAKKANICGINDHKELVAMLRQEQDVKDVKSNPIGFAAF